MIPPVFMVWYAPKLWPTSCATVIHVAACGCWVMDLVCMYMYAHVSHNPSIH